MLLLAAALATAAQPYRGGSPMIHGDGSVTFTLKAPDAAAVLLRGGFIPGTDGFGKGGAIEMARDADGTWSYTTAPLEANFHVYYYEVDGCAVLDPDNLKVVRNYDSFCNSFTVGGERTDFLEYSQAPRGTVASLWYDSPEYGGQRRMNVWIPAGYSPDRKYPVLYLLHGGGDDEDTWIEMGRLPQIMDNLTANGDAVPMIVVMPNDWTNQMAAQDLMDAEPVGDVFSPTIGEEGREAFFERSKFVADLVNNVIPCVESRFSVLPDRENRAIGGVSMGGAVLLNVIRTHPGLFDYIALLGSGHLQAERLAGDMATLKDAGYRLFYLGVGDGDMALPGARSTMEAMDGAELPYVWFNCHGLHNWTSWRLDLQDLIPRLFR